MLVFTGFNSHFRAAQSLPEPGPVDTDYPAGGRAAGHRFYIVQEGKIVLSKNAGGEVFEIGRAAAKRHFGEMALFDDSPRSATAEASEDSILLPLDRDRLRGLVDQKPEVAWAFCADLGVRPREANERLRSLRMRYLARVQLAG